jgi:adenosine deaminase CECR1
MKTFIAIVLLGFAHLAAADWFDDLRETGDAEDLYRVLYYMPKGGDLHNHLSGSNFSEWWYEMALAERDRGYRYYTKVRIENCVPYGGNEFGRAPYYLLFRNIAAHEYDALSDCEKREYKRLEELGDEEKAGWMDSIRLDQPYEGRDEFFGTHWTRLNALTNNPWLQAEALYRNMRAFGAEGITYLEPQIAVAGFRDPDGNPIPPGTVADIIRERLAQKDALATGVTVRLQLPILRFLPNAEDILRFTYQFVHDNSDIFVAVNMVGREDNDKGYPLRFLETLRELRRQYGGVRLSIHGQRHNAADAARALHGRNQPDQQPAPAVCQRLR